MLPQPCQPGIPIFIAFRPVFVLDSCAGAFLVPSSENENTNLTNETFSVIAGKTSPVGA